ncbi:PBP1A family penicillin-binding protein [Bacteroidetes/Chlorobi group bacterium ChocPot_Mid]|jgi:penicillin-binding protein 1A|nr:MAG: PBP1A family penicillin-binding protein [Bacteroidetes/Chlorobi group bacterium ChocPot_Mid]
MKPIQFLYLLLILLGIFLFAVWFYIQTVISYGLPSIDQMENPKQNLATQIISSDGELLDMFSVQRRIYLPYDSIPKDFINALIAVEDRKFFDHWGIHVSRVVKAAIKNVIAGGIKEGASTITMQLARNLFLHPRTTLERKVQEAFIAIQIEQTYTKQEILELYANTVIFGRGAYGIQVASEIYFNKSPKELTTAECAFLVGILKNPENYNGTVDYDKAIRRRNLVLELMEDEGYLTPGQVASAASEELHLAERGVSVHRRFMTAPHFVEMIRRQVSSDNQINKDLYRDGLVIYSTLNSKIQQYANEVVKEHMTQLQKTFNRYWSWSRNKDLLDKLILEAIKKRADYIAGDERKKKQIEQRLKYNQHFIDSVKNAATTLQIGLVVLDPTKGNILGMVGASPKFMEEHPDAKYSLNHATQIQRQPGSTFKPIVYACALETGMTPESKMSRAYFSYKDPYTGEVWVPRGSGKDIASDSVTLYQGLAASINTVAARLITEVTNPSRVVSTAYRMGITSKLQAVPALALGAGGEVIPLDLISAFGTFVNNGIHVKPYSVNSIEDYQGNIIQRPRKAIRATDVFNPQIADMMTYMMAGVVDRGTGSTVRKYFKNCAAAGKTGTTNDFADAWFIGFTPELVAGLWIGFDDRRITFPNDYGYASTAAAPLWGKLMNKIYSDPSLPFKKRDFNYSKVDSTNPNAEILRQMEGKEWNPTLNENEKDKKTNK